MSDAATPTRAFVTGAGGFIGRALVRRLRELGSEVSGVDLAPSGDPQVVVGDVSRPGDWQREAEGCDLVIHTAAIVGFYTDPRGFWEANVVATRRAIDAAIAGGASRFVHLSSIVVHGFDFEGEVDERSPVRPNGVPYVDTKVASERVVLAAHAEGEIETTIVRPGDVYGPESRAWTVEAVRLLKARQMMLPAGGRGRHSPVFVGDLVEGILAAATNPGGPGQTFILTGPEHPTFGEFVGHYCRMLGIDAPRTAPGAVLRAAARVVDRVERLRGSRNEVTPAAIDYFMRRGTYSIRRAREVLGYAPEHDLASGMEVTERWLREQRLL